MRRTLPRTRSSECSWPEHPAPCRTPRRYLATIARGLVIDLYRRRSLEQAYLEALMSRPELHAPSAETRALILDSLLAIDRMLDGLGARTRQIFLAVQLDGLS